MDDDVWELVCRARDDIRGGNVEEGLLLLDMVLAPKWADESECDGQYRMFDPDGGVSRVHNFFARALGAQIAIHCGERAA